MNYIITISLMLCPLFAIGQKTSILLEIQNASASYHAASQHISNALTKIDACYEATSTSEVHSAFTQAKATINNAQNGVLKASANTQLAASLSSDLGCMNASEQAILSTEYFILVERELNQAANFLAEAFALKNRKTSALKLDKVIDHLYEALQQIRNNAEQLNYIIDELEECDLSDFSELLATNSSTVATGSKDQVKKRNTELFGLSSGDLVRITGQQEAHLSPLHLYNAAWLSELTTYSNKNRITVVAHIRNDKFGTATTEYLFYDIPDKKWLAFFFGHEDPGLAYGERFEKYILPYCKTKE